MHSYIVERDTFLRIAPLVGDGKIMSGHLGSLRAIPTPYGYVTVGTPV